MNRPSRVCKRFEVEHLRKFLAYAKLRVNEARYYPPLNSYRYLVALALYSKCLTVAEATLTLLDGGFGDEAFGMTPTRTLTIEHDATQSSLRRTARCGPRS